ncbi:cytochrome c oxidase accessory protein CcoG [Lewinella sp. LCG006]|uniref:cytochrome c oxidase accessory protein CcoG n=1 Tax=Lewinella sp. LCG006 TaxID=3231911 RepID=UPI0034616647
MNANEINDTEEYRNSIKTVDSDGKRIWIYPKKPKGPWTNARTYVSWVLLAVLFGLPFVKINGNPLIRLDILGRDFYLFGMHFTPQDFYLFVVAMLTLVVFIALFTVVFGRLFCGWVCPQTIFMEMVFRKIEYWIEGDASAQRRLNNAPWTAEKIRKKTLKQALFILVAVLIAHTFLSYLIGPERVFAIVTSPPGENLGGFFAMIAFTGAFYFVFASLREQVCTTICPYGRLQGVLTDNDTILVAYDFVRGEPRGKKKRTPAKKANPIAGIQAAVAASDASTGVEEEAPLQLLGDCIDCTLCVQVCPTGIDIRDGVQLECVNCTACMDACDEVMVKIDRPKGLIRYDSHNGILQQSRKIFTPRAIAYSIALGVLIIVNIILFAGRTNVEAVILRTPGKLYYETEEGEISNLYNYQLFNKTENLYVPEFRFPDHPEAKIQFIGDAPELTPDKMVKGAFFILLPEDKVKERKQSIKIELWEGDKLLESTETNFLGPIK